MRPRTDANAFALRHGALIEKYGALIVGHFVGHTHNNAVSVQFDRATGELPVHVAYKVGGVTTFKNLNPGFRVATYDRALPAGQPLMLDFAEHWIDLNAANAAGPHAPPRWYAAPIASARAYYNIADLSPASWAAVGRALTANASAFAAYAADFYKNATQPAGAEATALELACEVLTSTKSQEKQCQKQ